MLISHNPPPRKRWGFLCWPGLVRFLQCYSAGVPFIKHVSLSNERANEMTLTVKCQPETETQLIDSVGTQVIRDPWTGLYSRAFMEEFLTLELSRARRLWYPIGVVLFRAPRPPPNNGMTDSAMQAILRVAAGFLGANVRQSDVACRYGEQEFALVIPKVTPEIAFQRAAELTRGLHELHIVWNEKIIGCPEFAFRVVGFPSHGCTVQEIVKAIDSPPASTVGN